MLADPLSMPQKATPHDSLPHDSLPHDSLPHDSMSHDSQPLLLECRGVDVRVSSRTLVASLDMQVRGGRMLAIL
jgi:hypothetical protein